MSRADSRAAVWWLGAETVRECGLSHSPVTIHPVALRVSVQRCGREESGSGSMHLNIYGPIWRAVVPREKWTEHAYRTYKSSYPH